MPTFTSKGVKYKTISTGPSRWSSGRVHLAYWSPEHRQWVTCCRPADVGPFSGFHCADTDELEPVTCRICLRHDARVGSTNPPPPAKEDAMPDEDAHSFWEDPDIQKAATGGDFAKFLNVGDTVSGKIRTLKKRDFDGRTAVEVEFDDEVKATFGQVLMLRDLYVMQPVPGEDLTVTLAKIEKRGAKTLKMFKVELIRLDGEVEIIDQSSS